MLSFRPSSSSPSSAAASLLVLSAAAAALLAASAADASPLPAAVASGEGKSPTQRPRSKDSGTSGLFRGGRFIDRGKVLKRVALQENNSSHTYGIAHVVSKPECSPFGKCRDGCGLDIQCRPLAEATAGRKTLSFSVRDIPILTANGGAVTAARVRRSLRPLVFPFTATYMCIRLFLCHI